MNSKKLYKKMMGWVRKYFNKTHGYKAVIGISGGKDSTLCAKILVDALGKENVIGVTMPQGTQHDIDVSNAVCEWLGIKKLEINIGNPVEMLYNEIAKGFDASNTNKGFDGAKHVRNCKVLTSNAPARIRMTTLYAVAATIPGARVCNTCNLSEDYVGYATKFGDAAGDFALLQDLTVTEILKFGRDLGIPEQFIGKTPEDGLSGLTDEQNLGFTYAELDRYICRGLIDDFDKADVIEVMHKRNLHKLLPMPKFKKGWF